MKVQETQMELEQARRLNAFFSDVATHKHFKTWLEQEMEKAISEIVYKKGEERDEAVGIYKTLKKIYELPEYINKELKHHAAN